jgi:hypothetical protein
MWAGERTARQHNHHHVISPQHTAKEGKSRSHRDRLLMELISRRLDPVKTLCEKHPDLADYCAAALKAKAPVDLEHLLRFTATIIYNRALRTL